MIFASEKEFRKAHGEMAPRPGAPASEESRTIGWPSFSSSFRYPKATSVFCEREVPLIIRTSSSNTSFLMRAMVNALSAPGS